MNDSTITSVAIECELPRNFPENVYVKADNCESFA